MYYSVEASPYQWSRLSRRLKSVASFRFVPFAPFNVDMASRPGRANPKHLSLQPSNLFETMDQKRRRLRPDLYADNDTTGGDGVTATAAISSSSGSAPPGVSAVPAAKGKPGCTSLFKTGSLARLMIQIPDTSGEVPPP